MSQPLRFLIREVAVHISCSNFSTLLGLQPKTMYRWPACCKPKVAALNSGRPMYAYDAVDEWFAKPGRTYGFTSPLTIAQLVSAEVTLVRLTGKLKIALHQGYPHSRADYIPNKILKGQLPAVDVGNTNSVWVLSVEGIDRFIAAQIKLRQNFTYAQMFHIFGASPSVLARIISYGELSLVSLEMGDLTKGIVREGMERIFPRLLVGRKISFDDWVERRRTSLEPLVGLPEACVRLGLESTDVVHLARKGEIVAITTLGGSKLLFCPESVATYSVQDR